MIAFKIFRNLLIGLLLLISPVLIGYLLNSLNIQPMGFALYAIYPQLIIAPYIMYFSVGSSLALWLSAFHWVFVFFFCHFFFRKYPISNYAVFTLFMIIFSALLLHIIMYLSGFKLNVDSV